MAKRQRDKGARGERELAKALSEFLNLDVLRNLNQTRDAGHDLEGLPVALEVKRQETLKIATWWDQTIRQSIACDKPPALAYRQNHKQWRFVIPGYMLSDSLSDTGMDLSMTAEVGIELFCVVVSGLMCSTETA